MRIRSQRSMEKSIVSTARHQNPTEWKSRLFCNKQPPRENVVDRASVGTGPQDNNRTDFVAEKIPWPQVTQRRGGCRAVVGVAVDRRSEAARARCGEKVACRRRNRQQRLVRS
ncbi:Protein of unknown function [Gryllus bimaculatus]|nr:Protein of unknown function [Gryllus bimaculatus]